jgi:hypothetical protein
MSTIMKLHVCIEAGVGAHLTLSNTTHILALKNERSLELR